MTNIQFLQHIWLFEAQHLPVRVPPAGHNQEDVLDAGPDVGETHGLDEGGECHGGLHGYQRHVKLGETAGVGIRVAQAKTLMTDHLLHPDVHMFWGALIFPIAFL